MSNKVLILLFVALVFVIAGCYLLVERGGSLGLNDEQALVLAAQKMSSLDSYTTDINLEFTGQSPEMTISEVLTSRIKSDNQKEAASGTIDLNLQIQEAGQEIILNFEGEVTVLDNQIFAKITTVPEIIQMFIPAEMIGQWILFSGNLKEEMIAEMTEQGLNIDQLEAMAEELVVRFWERGVFIVTAKEKDRIDGISLNKYTVEIIPEKIISFLEEDFMPLIEEIGGEELSSLSEEDKEEMISQLEAVLEHLDLYIWSDGKYLHLIRVDAQIIEYEMVDQATIALEMKFHEFNKPVTIEAPDEFVPVEEIVEGLVEGIVDLLFDRALGTQSLF